MEYSYIVKDYQHKKFWKYSFGNELGRLAQRVGKIVKLMDTLLFVSYKNVPSEIRKYVTYGYIVVDYRPQKEYPNRTTLTGGGNIIE